MEKDKIKVSVIIDKQALIDKAFKNAEIPDEFNEVRLIVEDSDELVRDTEKLENEKRRNANIDLFSGVALDILLCKYNQAKMAIRLEKAKEKLSKEKAKAKEAYENLKKKLGEDNPLISSLGEIFDSEEE